MSRVLKLPENSLDARGGQAPFRFKRGIRLPYSRQGYIFFTSRMYHSLPPERQQVIWNLCLRCGGGCYQALFEFVTTDVSATAVCLKHYLASRTSLYRALKRYYEEFPPYL